MPDGGVRQGRKHQERVAQTERVGEMIVGSERRQPWGGSNGGGRTSAVLVKLQEGGIIL